MIALENRLPREILNFDTVVSENLTEKFLVVSGRRSPTPFHRFECLVATVAGVHTYLMVGVRDGCYTPLERQSSGLFLPPTREVTRNYDHCESVHGVGFIFRDESGGGLDLLDPDTATPLNSRMCEEFRSVDGGRLEGLVEGRWLPIKARATREEERYTADTPALPAVSRVSDKAEYEKQPGGFRTKRFRGPDNEWRVVFVEAVGSGLYPISPEGSAAKVLSFSIRGIETHVPILKIKREWFVLIPSSGHLDLSRSPYLSIRAIPEVGIAGWYGNPGGWLLDPSTGSPLHEAPFESFERRGTDVLGRNTISCEGKLRDQWSIVLEDGQV